MHAPGSVAREATGNYSAPVYLILLCGVNIPSLFTAVLATVRQPVRPGLSGRSDPGLAFPWATRRSLQWAGSRSRASRVWHGGRGSVALGRQRQFRAEFCCDGLRRRGELLEPAVAQP